jgi:hypothetical protein
MAEVADAEPDLRALARRIPEDTRAILTPVEMHLRLVEASNLLADAETAGSEVKADRLRAKAGRVLKAATPRAYSLAMAVLGEDLRQANLDNDSRRAYQIQSDMADFDRRNPQPDPERVLAAVQAQVTRLRIPPAQKSRLFSRNRGR